MIGRRPSRTPGRHRDGQPHTVVHQRVWDGPARAEADRLDRTWPDWTVLYSLGNRRFYAVASWPSSEPVLVEDETATGLETRMYEAEMARIARREAPATVPASPPPSDRRGGARSQAPAAAPQHPYPSRRSHRRAA
ncbi:hypothetical protein AB0395_33090 [Streptosporangium sp. NPDC051023]|uniref:hypothetical protein n=1 Tax=Streptosporangium sp. NPDC051023 TaxID=3155410 RepID=UPI0034506F67